MQGACDETAAAAAGCMQQQCLLHFFYDTSVVEWQVEILAHDIVLLTHDSPSSNLDGLEGGCSVERFQNLIRLHLRQKDLFKTP